MNKFRPSAIPLLTVDPYFSIWSSADKLYNDITRHWTGRRNSISMFVTVDGKEYRVMGKSLIDNYRYKCESEVIEQIDCVVDATQTYYVFENDILKLNLKFTTPLLMDDLYLMTRPVGYISYNIEYKDSDEHNTKVEFRVSSECCVNDEFDEVNYGVTDYSVFCGKGEKDILKSVGDDKAIEWGNIHLVAPGAEYRILIGSTRDSGNWEYVVAEEMAGTQVVKCGYPVISSQKSYSATQNVLDFVCVAYDDIYSIEYFGERLKPYWTENGDTFETVVSKALDEYAKVCKKCDSFDKDLREKGLTVSEKYADIISLVYRQVIAAHKLVQKDGELLFFSKECYSNGCIGTVDVTYPSIPMFLIYNPELVRGMLNPIFEYAKGYHGWEYEFAPHDVGTYPKANGQVYGYEKDDPEYILSRQMPVEECGNMILCVAAYLKYGGDIEFLKQHYDILKQWSDYLLRFGYDPGNQLCTDDFAGHLEHNCNLSIKAILAIAAFGKMMNLLNKDGSKYLNKAKEFAELWGKESFDGDHYKLAFDKKGSWSLKYNLIWDKFLDINMFDEKVTRTEVDFYKSKMNKYGIPLDSRKDYTKSDWQMWTTCLASDSQYMNMVIDAMWQFVNDTPDRVPFADWYETKTPYKNYFQNRTVQGGLFAPLL